MRICLLMVLAMLASSSTYGHDSVEFYAVPDSSDLPFSDAVRVGNLLFLAGKLGNIPGTRELASGGIEGQTRQAMQHIKSAVERYGSSMNHVVKCTVFMADMDEWAAMNAVYITFFPEHPPARSAVGTSGLALDARVEIECIAALP